MYSLAFIAPCSFCSSVYNRYWPLCSRVGFVSSRSYSIQASRYFMAVWCLSILGSPAEAASSSMFVSPFFVIVFLTS